MHFDAYIKPFNLHLLPSIQVIFGLNEEAGKLGHPMIILSFLCWELVVMF